MFGKVSPLFDLFDRQFGEARSLLNALGKNFRSRKALELEEKLIFINVYFHILNKIHFQEERLKFESYSSFNAICKSLKRIRHYKLAVSAFEEEKIEATYSTYEHFLLAEKKAIYKNAYEIIVSRPSDIWEPLYASAYDYSKGTKPLEIDTATRQVIDEELEYINFKGKEGMDSQALRDIMQALQIITVVENVKVAIGLNPVFTSDIHQEMKTLSKALARWNQTYLFAQHLNYFLSDNEGVGKKYLGLARRTKEKRKG